MKKQLFLFCFVVVALFVGTTVGAQTYLNVTTETAVELTQTNIIAADYLTAATENWVTDKTYCEITGTFYNMSSTNRMIHIDVSNVLFADVYVSNSTAGRTYFIKVGDGAAQTITHGGTNCEMVTVAVPSTANTRITLSGGGSSVYPAKVVLHPASAATPVVLKTSGDNPVTIMETETLEPVVYTYYNVANDANVVAGWFTDDTYTATASAPAGLAFAQDATANTMTLSGIPTVAGTYYYKLTVNETGGNSLTGVVVVTPFQVIVQPACREARLGSDFTSALPSYVFSTTDVLHGIDATGTPINLPNRNTTYVCADASYRVQFTYVALHSKSGPVNKIEVYGTSSGSSSRTISKLEVGTTLTGTYTEVTGLTASSTITTTECGVITIENLDIPVNSFIRFTFNGNVNFSGMDLCSVDTSTSLADAGSSFSVQVSDARRITVLSSSITTDDRISVFNLAGQQVALQQVAGSVTVVNQSLNAGVYLVKVNNYIQKVIVP